MSLAGTGRISSRALAAGEEDRAAPAERAHSNDLALELFRQRTLLQILSGRMRETAAGLERVGSFDPVRLRRGLEAHRQFLREVHLPDGQRLLDSVATRHVLAAGELRRVLEESGARADDFQRGADALVAREGVDGTGEARRLSKLFYAEADRVETFLTWEADGFHPRIMAWLPKLAQTRLLGELRRFDAARIGAEIALISWASQLHPSAD